MLPATLLFPALNSKGQQQGRRLSSLSAPNILSIPPVISTPFPAPRANWTLVCLIDCFFWRGLREVRISQSYSSWNLGE